MQREKTITFKDRADAGIQLAKLLKGLKLKPPLVVLGLPRGGVPVAYEVAKALKAPLDILSVRKIGAPGHEELACGALASGGVTVWNRSVLEGLGLSEEDLQAKVYLERKELVKREEVIRGADTPVLDIAAKCVVIVDDGMATGATMRAAIKAVKERGVARVVVALPVAPGVGCDELLSDSGSPAVDVVCVNRVPEGEFGSVGSWYRDFSQVESSACREVLKRGGQRRAAIAIPKSP
jgi:predicted phosphoribosyltransferase